MSLRGKKAAGSSKTSPITAEESEKAGRDTIYNLIASMYLNPEYSDLTIICKGRQFTAHKVVVCQRSEHLNGLCKNYQDPSKPLVINRDPTLLGKVLEFLYQADYTVPKSVVASDFRTFKKTLRAKACAKQQIYKRPANPEPDEIEEQDTLEESEQLDDESVTASPEEEEEEETEENILGDDDPFLGNCHPCYFHARIYGEGDYFRIKDLKAKAKMHFTNAFLDSPDEESFKKTIEEIYSPRAVYVELRAEAVKIVVENLKVLWEGSSLKPNRGAPVLTRELLKSVPEFTAELFPAFLDLCVKKNIFTHLIDPSPNTPQAKEALSTTNS